ncbi:CHRD domain-containing protein [Streptomyces sp. 3N207]|uniref:CHRD domain-containing protein n=1 Tax=Streptomyces sp. 3N207 TaxID=3457417 RepID=UPI003FD19AB5
MKNRHGTIAFALSVTAVAAAAGVGLTVLPDNGGDGGNGDRKDDRKSADHGSGYAAHSAHGAKPAGGLGTLHGSDMSSAGATFFAGSLNGANEVPAAGGPAVGDKDGKALALMRIKDTKVSFAFSFRGIATPTAAHIHQGVKGKNGDIKIPLFAKKAEEGRTTVTGKVTVKDTYLLDALRSDPNGFYFNLHTGEFPGGAVRGQVHKLTTKADMNRMLSSSRSSVIKGSQIYTCTKQDDGTYAFTQNNVRALLEGRIAHFFAKPGPEGPPAWLALDGSAVTGKLLSKTPNGKKNIPELDLAAKQVGKHGGKLSRTAEILRLNTEGGVAPSGTCDPMKQRKVAVPYRADYVFINR